MKTLWWLAIFCFATAASAAEPHFVFLLLSGFNSHQSRGDLFMYRQLKDLTPPAQTSFILVSFSGILAPADPEEMYVEVLPENLPPPSYDYDSRMVPDELASLIRRQIRDPRDTYVVIVGHSHGGWWAMKSVLSLPKDARILRLVTIDPISWMLCNPSTYASGLSLNPSAEADAQYTRAPSDLISDGPHISRRVHPGVWVNYYQDQFPLMHSGRIERADINERRAYGGGESIAHLAHVQIFFDPNIWSEIREWVREDVSRKLPHILETR